jgi:hypothetical protein
MVFSLQAQEDVDSSGFEGFKSTGRIPYKQNVIKFSPVPMFVGQIPYCGEIRLTYERMIAYNHSLLLGASYNYPNIILLMMSAVADPPGQGFKRYSLRGGRVIFGYRYYPLKSKDAPEGLYFGPYFSYNFVKIKERKGDGSYEMLNYANASMVAGYQIEMRDGWFCDFMAGLGYRRNFVRSYDAQTNRVSTNEMEGITVIRNIKLTLQINFCYGF